MKLKGRQFLYYATRIYLAGGRRDGSGGRRDGRGVGSGSGAWGGRRGGNGLMLGRAGLRLSADGLMRIWTHVPCARRILVFCGARAGMAGGGSCAGPAGWIVNECTPRKIFGKWGEYE